MILAEPSSSIITFWGFDVAVDDVAGVGDAEGPSDLDRVSHRLADRQPPQTPDPLLERLALDVLEDDVGAARVLAGVDHPDDVGMGELGDRARLTAEALELVGIGRHLPVHQLDRHLALQRLVHRAIDRRHAARADPRLQPIAPAERRAEDRAHLSPSILRYLPVIQVLYYTDPACPWSWALEPSLRKLLCVFGESLRFTYVMCGMAREFSDSGGAARPVAGGRRPQRHAGRPAPVAGGRTAQLVPRLHRRQGGGRAGGSRRHIYGGCGKD